MTEDTLLLIGILSVVAAALIGFFVGRNSGGARKRVEALEAEVSRQKEELSDYRREVESHFDQAASLFGSMAGSYKELFEHLSSGYEKLSGGSARQLFRGKVGGLLLGSAGVAAAADDISSTLADEALDSSSADELQPVKEERSEATDETKPQESAVAPGETTNGSAVSDEDALAKQPETASDEVSSTPSADETRPDGTDTPAPETPAEAAEKTPGEPEPDGGEPNARKGDEAGKS